jgi:hypothetical protein
VPVGGACGELLKAMAEVHGTSSPETPPQHTPHTLLLVNSSASHAVQHFVHAPNSHHHAHQAL